MVRDLEPEVVVFFCMADEGEEWMLDEVGVFTGGSDFGAG